jgi:hypothetical protein
MKSDAILMWLINFNTEQILLNIIAKFKHNGMLHSHVLHSITYKRDVQMQYMYYK